MVLDIVQDSNKAYASYPADYMSDMSNTELNVLAKRNFSRMKEILNYEPNDITNPNPILFQRRPDLYYTTICEDGLYGYIETDKLYFDLFLFINNMRSFEDFGFFKSVKILNKSDLMSFVGNIKSEKQQVESSFFVDTVNFDWDNVFRKR
jgi:hypothetical protein